MLIVIKYQFVSVPVPLNVCGIMQQNTFTAIFLIFCVITHNCMNTVYGKIGLNSFRCYEVKTGKGYKAGSHWE